MLKRRSLVLAAGAAVVPHARRAYCQSVRTLRITYLYSRDSQLGAGATAMAEEVAKRTNGAIRIQQFPDAALGGDANMLNGLQLGSIDLAFVTGSYLPSIVPELDAVQIPFLFRDTAHAHAALDGVVGQDLLKRLGAKDLMPLAWGENGLRHITNSKHEILAPEDLKGLKLRLPPSDVLSLGFQALGAETGTLPLPKLYDALQTGQFDGEENPIATILSTNLQKVQKFLTLSGHVYSPAAIIMSPDSYDELSATEKAIFADAAKLGAQASRDYAARADQAGVETMRAAGMRVVSEIDRARFAAAMSSTAPEFERRFGRELIDRLRAAA